MTEDRKPFKTKITEEYTNSLMESIMEGRMNKNQVKYELIRIRNEAYQEGLDDWKGQAMKAFGAWIDKQTFTQ